MREKENFDEDQNHSEDKERDDFPAGEPSQIMPKKEERKTNCRDNSRPCHAGNFEFQICAQNSTQQQQRRERSDPKGDLLEASWLDRYHVAREAGFLG